MTALLDLVTENPQIVTALAIPLLVRLAKWVRDRVIDFVPDELLPVLATVLGEVIGQVANMPTGSGAIAGLAGVGVHQTGRQVNKMRKSGGKNETSGKLRGM